MSRLKQLFFTRRGKPASGWYDFEIHRFVRAPRIKWVKVTVFYEGSARGSYHVDCGAVDSAYVHEVDEKVKVLKKKVKLKVLRTMKWHGPWVELEMALGLRLGVAVEDDGSVEEWCEVWRV